MAPLDIAELGRLRIRALALGADGVAPAAIRLGQGLALGGERSRLAEALRTQMSAISPFLKKPWLTMYWARSCSVKLRSFQEATR